MVFVKDSIFVLFCFEIMEARNNIKQLVSTVMP